MAEILTSYLQRMAAQPYKIGYADCATFGIGWIDQLRGTDHAMRWHKNYTTVWGCRAFIARGGGMVACISRFLADTHGITMATRPARGNIVCARLQGIEAIGIRLSDTTTAHQGGHGVLVESHLDITGEWAV